MNAENRNVWIEKIPDKSKYQEDQVRFRKDFGDHILTRHGGVIATTCHRCLSLKQAIRSNEWMIRDVEKAEASLLDHPENL